jgi:tetratricopeptide (TPR) repeat protein
MASGNAPGGRAEVTPPIATPPSAAPRATAPEKTAPPPLVTSSGEDAGQGAGWAVLLGQGAYQQIVAEGERTGIERCLRRCSAGAMLALADAARYQGRLDLGRRVLDALVQRGAQAPALARAHYLLGQMAEGKGAHDRALEEYERCQVADGDASYAGLALGRTMTLRAAAGELAAAREAAQRYLRRFPAGPYAEQARELGGVAR